MQEVRINNSAWQREAGIVVNSTARHLGNIRQPLVTNSQTLPAHTSSVYSISCSSRLYYLHTLIQYHFQRRALGLYCDILQLSSLISEVFGKYHSISKHQHLPRHVLLGKQGE